MDIPIIVLTGIRDERTALTAIRFGAQDYLVKSEFNPENIGKSIKYAIERFRLFNSVSRLSRTDELTGLSNRRGFYALAAKQYQFAVRNRLYTHIVYIDIDNLKSLNDTYGHETGDTLIKDSALLLKNVFREWDVIARMGGDEFAVLVITGRSEDIESGVITRIKDQVLEYNKGGKPYKLSLSYGISRLYDFSREALKDALNEADSLMYDNKKIKKVI
jgi:diguanylate cyclase (GGDEF)-like protein